MQYMVTSDIWWLSLFPLTECCVTQEHTGKAHSVSHTVFKTYCHLNPPYRCWKIVSGTSSVDPKHSTFVGTRSKVPQQHAIWCNMFSKVVHAILFVLSGVIYCLFKWMGCYITLQQNTQESHRIMDHIPVLFLCELPLFIFEYSLHNYTIVEGEKNYIFSLPRSKNFCNHLGIVFFFF